MLKKTVLTFAFLTILTTFYGFNAKFSTPVTDDMLNEEADFGIFDSEDISFAFDTVFIVRKREDITSLDPLREYLGSIGDSLVIGEDDEAFKVHVHTNIPGDALSEAQKYGTLDWRLSDSFAIYWATLGIMYSPERQNIDCDRMITQSLKESFIAGRILLPGKEPTMNYMLIPNLDLVDAVRKTSNMPRRASISASSAGSAGMIPVIRTSTVSFSANGPKMSRTAITSRCMS